MTIERRAQEFLDRLPGHARVLGPPGSGKTTLLAERYRALAARGRRPGIVAFGREQQERLLDLVLPPGGAHLGPAPVTTHALLASAILDAARPGRPRTLRDVDERLVLGRLLRREPALLASDLADIAGSATFLGDLIEALHALAQHGLDTGSARKCANDSKSPRVRDVFHVYARYRDVCAERGLVTFYDAAWRAAERFEADGIVSPLAAFDVVLIDDFHDLDPGQFRLLSRLVPPDGPTALEVFGDPTGARFAFRGTTERFFARVFPEEYAPADFVLTPPEMGDVALGETIRALVVQTSYEAPDPGVAGGSAAPSTERAGPDLPLFQEANAPPDADALDARHSACTATLVIADDEIAEAQAIASRIRAVLDAGTPARDIAIIARDPAHDRPALAVACHEWGVPLDAGGDGHGAAEDFVRSLLGALGADAEGRLVEALEASPFFPAFRGDERDAASLVRQLRRDYATRGGGFDLEKLVGERVTPMLPRGDTASHAAVAAVVEEWRRYGEVVGSAGGGASLDEFRATYMNDPVHRRTAPGRVALLSPREATGRSFASVFVCGCAEGYFPAAAARDGYLSMTAIAQALEATDKDAAADLAARVDETAVERAENALFLTAITRARDTLTLLAPAKIQGAPTLPADVLTAGEHAFADDKSTRLESPCARAASATAAASPSRELAKRLTPLDATAGWWASPSPAPRFPALGEFRMSASKLGSFARCARQFFYREVLKIQEPESIYLRAGLLVHRALEEVIPAGATGPEIVAALRDNRTREVAERLVAREMRKEGDWVRDLSVRYLLEILEHVAELEATRQGEYRVRLQEEPVRKDVDGMPLRGKVDRVDDVEGLGAVIIDYKTSAQFDKTFATLVNKMEEKYWQVPVYTTLVPKLDVEPAAFIYYVVRPGEDSFATGVQVAPGRLPSPMAFGGSKGRPRYDAVPREVIDKAMADAVAIHRSIIGGECAYERTTNIGLCPNCHFARICQRSKASI